MDLITTSANLCGSGHYSVIVDVDGVPYAFTLHDNEHDLLVPPTEEQIRQALLVKFRLLRQKSVSIIDFQNRILAGEDTPMKVYDFVSPGSAVVVTDIGTVYRNILPGNGIPIFVDPTGMRKFKFMFNANLIAAGSPYRVQIIRDSDGILFYESPSIAATGEQPLETPLLTQADLGAAWPSWATTKVLLRAQMKGNNATADPVVRRLQLAIDS